MCVFSSYFLYLGCLLVTSVYAQSENSLEDEVTTAVPVHINATTETTETTTEPPSKIFSIPTNLTITILNSTSFNVSWEEASEITPSLGYKVNVTRIHVASESHLWKNCTGRDEVSKEVQEMFFVFSDALPDFVYNVTVEPASENGTVARVTINTPIDASDPPENISIVPNEEETYPKHIETTLNLTWDIPCNTNGPVKEFHIEIAGYYKRNKTIIDLRNYPVTVSPDQTRYSSEFENIQAASNYIVKIYLTGNMTGVAAERSFITKDFSTPTNLTITILNSTSFNVSWEEASEITPLLGYKVNVTRIHVASESHLWKNCTGRDLVSEDVKEMFFVFSDALPDFVYNVTVEPASENGTIARDTINTPIDASDPPKNISIVLNEEETYPKHIETTLNLTWDIPCNTNGPVKEFHIEIAGYYKRNKTITDLRNYPVTVSPDQTRYSSEFENIQAASNYIVKIYLTGNMTGVAAERSFITKDFSTPTNLTITILNSTSFNVSWEEASEITPLLGYKVNVTRMHVASESHLWKNCTGRDLVSEDVKEMFFVFSDALPDFVYNVTVEPASENGTIARDAINTPIDASDPPKNISTALNETVPYPKYTETTLNLTWDIPCNTNGPVNEFHIEIAGYYKRNKTIIDLRNYPVTVSPDQTRYSSELKNIQAASNYTVKIYLTGNMTGVAGERSFTTNATYPSAPKVIDQIIDARSFTIDWHEPTNNSGEIISYTVFVKELEMNWNKTDHCDASNAKDDVKTTSETIYSTNVAVPDTNYNVSLYANTSRGAGNWTVIMITTNMTFPQLVSISSTFLINSDPENNPDEVKINFISGCFNGKFQSYDVHIVGERDGYEDVTQTEIIDEFDANSYTFPLKPEYSYTVQITLNNQEYHVDKSLNFTAPSGVPDNRIPNIPITAQETGASLLLQENYFNRSRGELLYFAIIVSTENITGKTYKEWDESYWPTPEENSETHYQITPNFWQPFEDSYEITYVVGSDTSCSALNCNKPLLPDTEYFLFIRLFNAKYYRDTAPIRFKTEKPLKIGLIVGTALGVVLMATTVLISYKRWTKDVTITSPQSDRTGSKTEIPIAKFIEHCTYLEQHPEVLREQWKELEEQSKTIYADFENRFALLPENRWKNRYINMLPFDNSRVKLNIDEDDEIASDYINASYIKGKSNKNEYIVTQGPLPETCRDFWKMVLQENVTVIVMLCQFIENRKEKCYKYFPNNREKMIIGDIEVRCRTELHFGFHCVRTLQIKKKDRQITVTHMQFLEWPDFGVPKGTEIMLNFCRQFRERWISEGEIALVHCSAGVGRTGTLVTTDIVSRAIEARRNIDIFNTVLELRRQRKSMVQTEGQYLYIHQLIKSTLENPEIEGQLQ